MTMHFSHWWAIDLDTYVHVDFMFGDCLELWTFLKSEVALADDEWLRTSMWSLTVTRPCPDFCGEEACCFTDDEVTGIKSIINVPLKVAKSGLQDLYHMIFWL